MSQGQYVAAAYAAVFVVLLGYVAIIAAKLQRLQRETTELVELAHSRRPAPLVAERVGSEATGEA